MRTRAYDRTARARTTGAEVRVCSAEAAAADPDGGPWVTICEAHAALLNHATLEAARAWAAHPEEWCEECRALHQRTDDLLAELEAA